MTDTFIVVVGIIFLFWIGYSVIELFSVFPKASLLEKLGFSYGLGAGFVILQLFLYSLFHITWNIVSVLVPWFVLCFIYWLRSKHKLRKSKLNFPRKFIDKIFLFLLIGNSVYIILESLSRPLLAWDGWATFFLVAKAFFYSGNLDTSVIAYAHTSNPPGLNLLLAYFYILLRHFNDSTVLLIWPAFYISILILLYSSLRQIASQRLSLGLTLLFSLTPNLVRHGGRFDTGNADIILGYFFFFSFLLLKDFIIYRKTKTLILLNFVLGIGALIKSEGVPSLIIINSIAILYIFYKKDFSKLIVFLIGFCIVGIWQVIKVMNNLPSNPFVVNSFMWNRIPIIFSEFGKEFLNIRRWNLLWIGFVLSMFILRLKKEYLFTAAIVLLQLAVYFGVYLKTNLNPVAHIESSFDRLLLHLAPIAFYAVSVWAISFLENKKK